MSGGEDVLAAQDIVLEPLFDRILEAAIGEVIGETGHQGGAADGKVVFKDPGFGLAFELVKNGLSGIDQAIVDDVGPAPFMGVLDLIAREDIPVDGGVESDGGQGWSMGVELRVFANLDLVAPFRGGAHLVGQGVQVEVSVHVAPDQHAEVIENGQADIPAAARAAGNGEGGFGQEVTRNLEAARDGRQDMLHLLQPASRPGV